MENNKVQRSQPTDLATSPLFDNVTRLIYQLNQVRTFPLTDVEINEWSRTILDNFSEVDLEKLSFIIENFKKEILDYDQKVGVQNIFRARKLVYRDEKGKLKVYNQDIF